MLKADFVMTLVGKSLSCLVEVHKVLVIKGLAYGLHLRPWYDPLVTIGELMVFKKSAEEVICCSCN